MVTFTYHTTPQGHQVKLTVHGDISSSSSQPVLITFHGGGIINGSRLDDYVPEPMKSKWPGLWISADYRLLLPSTGKEIDEDVRCLFDYLSSTRDFPIDLENVFMAGFSGGGYPLRLAIMHSTQELESARPRWKLKGWASYFGMGGDMLLDRWCKPHDPATHLPLSLPIEELISEQQKWKDTVSKWVDASEVSEKSYTPGLSGYDPSRDDVWKYLHVNGSLNDLITGIPHLGQSLSTVSRPLREGEIPHDVIHLFPQVYFEKNKEKIPPGLLIHGDADPVVPYDESLKTYDTLKSNGKVELITIKGGDHSLCVDGVVQEDSILADEYTVKWMLAKCT